jgi:hypothetical protein
MRVIYNGCALPRLRFASWLRAVALRFASSMAREFGLDSAVASLAFLESDNRFIQMTLLEIRPQRVRYPDLSVRDLP